MSAVEIHGSDFLTAGDKALIVFIFIVPLIVAFVVGLVIGSLSNVVVYRLVHYRSIWSPPSHCPRCRNEIPWFDNIPIVSWLLLRGRCRFCKGPISIKYPVVELISGLLYAGIMYRFLYAPYLPDDIGGLSLHFDIATIPFLFKTFVFATFLLILAVIDIETQLLPNRLTISGLLIALVLSPFVLPNREDVYPFARETLFHVAPWLDGLLQSVTGMLVGGGIIFIIAIIGFLIYKFGAMGIGDVKLTAMIGAFVGLTNIGPALFIGFVTGGVFSVVMMIMKMAGLRSLIPFGPYLCLGGLIAMLYGPDIIHWYLGYT